MQCANHCMYLSRLWDLHTHCMPRTVSKLQAALWHVMRSCTGITPEPASCDGRLTEHRRRDTYSVYSADSLTRCNGRSGCQGSENTSVWQSLLSVTKSLLSVSQQLYLLKKGIRLVSTSCISSKSHKCRDAQSA